MLFIYLNLVDWVFNLKEDWPNCGRYFHFRGGAYAMSPPQTDLVDIWPPAICGKSLQLTLPDFTSYSTFYKLDFELVGVDFITHYGEFNGESPPQWRTHAKQEASWPNWRAFQHWGNLATSSGFNKNGLCYDLSNRISYQLTTINDQLKELSLCYRAQLNAIVLKSNIKENQRFQDGFTNKVYQRFHSFLFDACILRDYLCEFVYNFSGNGRLKIENKHITTAGKLYKILKKQKEYNSVEKELLIAMSDGGWLKELGAYRDLVMHSAPICIANDQLYCIQELKPLPNGKEMPLVRFPIPSDPDSISANRSNINSFDSYINNIEAIAKASLEDYGKYDCLEYANIVVNKLSNLALTCSAVSPVEPMINHLIQTENGTISTVRKIVPADIKHQQ